MLTASRLPQRLSQGKTEYPFDIAVFFKLVTTRADTSRGSAVTFFGKLLSGIAIGAFLAGPAVAGDDVLYQPPAAWVVAPTLPTGKDAESGIVVLLDKQVRFEPGKTLTYSDFAYRAATPEIMTQLGTLQATWLPDKGDLTVHRIEIVRGGEVINLVKQGARFEVIRREQGLERRQMTGALTATVALPGVQLGDIVRMSITVSSSDQVLGQEVQAAEVLLPEASKLPAGRISVTWPADMPIALRTFRTQATGATTERGGYKTWSLTLPVADPDEMPDDSPLRYQLPPLVQAGSFADWREVSTVMEPHYRTDGAIPATGPLREAVRTIERENAGQRDRATAALMLVQDQISYLMNGMDGGNYRPQTPADTWQQRFGDCKAKTLLLLAMLREMGIQSEAVLVRSQGGDALPQMLPMALNFDHVIVRATIDGTDFWLDGTGSGASSANLDEVPRFFHALPITAVGADLIPMPERPQTKPNVTVALTLDQRAGITLPTLYNATFEVSGAQGAMYRVANAQLDKETRAAAAQALVADYLGETQILDHTIAYDEAARVARVTVSGLMTSPWEKERGRYRLKPPAQVAANVGFDAERARPEWRQVPLRLNGPIYHRSEVTVLLPDEAGGFTLEGKPSLDKVIGGVAMKSDASLQGGKLLVRQAMQSQLTELAAEQIPVAKRELTAFMRDLPELRAPEGARENDDYVGPRRAAFKPIEDMYAKLIAQETDDENRALAHRNRMNFYYGVRDFKAALRDADASLKIEPDAATHERRGEILMRLGRLEEALAALRQGEELAGDGATLYQQVELLGVLKRPAEIDPLVEEYRSFVEKEYQGDLLAAQALGWQGQYAEGLALLRQVLEDRPGDPEVLNELCWFGAIWNRVDDALLQTCEQAVVKSDYSGQALDSRGVAYVRAGRTAEALADFTAALADGKEINASRYMRGLVKLQAGDTSARADVDRALHVDPYLSRLYARWGFTPPK